MGSGGGPGGGILMIYPIPGGVFLPRADLTFTFFSLFFAYPTLTPLTPGWGGVGGGWVYGIIICDKYKL